MAARAGSASWDDAAAALDRVSLLASSAASRGEVQAEKGKLFSDVGEWKKALDAFDAALREDPGNRKAKQLQPAVLERLGQQKQ